MELEYIKARFLAAGSKNFKKALMIYSQELKEYYKKVYTRSSYSEREKSHEVVSRD